MISSVFALFASVAAVAAQSCTPSYGGHSVYEEVTAPALFQASLQLLGAADPIVIEVNRTWSPVGADHFYALLRDGYYQCAAFYNIKTGANGYAQAGIAADAGATTKWADFIEDDDVSVARRSNTQYTLAYVPLDGYGTRSTHFMINLDDNSYLDGSGFYPFAQVVDGFDTLAVISAEEFALSDDEKTSYTDGGNDWLLSVYSESDLALISSFSVEGSGGSGGKQDRSGSWAFGVIMVVLSSAACVYGGLYIYRYIRKQQGYDTMLEDSGSGSSDRIVNLNLQT